MRNRFVTIFRLGLGCCLVALMAPAAANAAWHEPVGGPQPINESSDQDATFPSLASVGGVAYVAWQESGGSAGEIHVARLNGAGTAWELVGGSGSIAGLGGSQPSLTGLGGVPSVAFTEFDDDGDVQVHVARLASNGTTWERVGESDDPAKPINESASQDALFPSLTQVAGVPYVAWQEFDGTNTEIRVARLKGGGTGWEQPVGGASPINFGPSNNAIRPSLAAIGGVPYVAWSEFDGNNDIRVARLNGAETDWDPVGETDNPSSPINESAGGNAQEPSLTGIGGVPYVAWRETPPVTGTQQVRVARLSDDETGWDKVAGGLSPINESSSGQSTDPSLIGIDGVPYVAWSEADPGGPFAAWVARVNSDGTAWEKVPDSVSPVDPDVGLADPSMTAIGDIPYVAYRGLGATNSQARVSRLEPEFQVAAAPSGTGATLIGSVRAFGLPYQVGFEYGPGGFTSETPTVTTSGDVDLITQNIAGLSPSTTYDFRAFALAGLAAPRVLGAGAQFGTSAAPISPPSGGSAPVSTKKKCKKGRKLKHGRCVKKKKKR